MAPEVEYAATVNDRAQESLGVFFPVGWGASERVAEQILQCPTLQRVLDITGGGVGEGLEGGGHFQKAAPRFGRGDGKQFDAAEAREPGLDDHPAVSFIEPSGGGAEHGAGLAGDVLD